jgi:hypothetical protein
MSKLNVFVNSSLQNMGKLCKIMGKLNWTEKLGLDREVGPHSYGQSLVPSMLLDEERWASGGALQCSVGEQPPVARRGRGSS